MKNIPQMFGQMVFNDDVMRDRLPKDIYKALKDSIAKSENLSLEVANSVANAMKNWALEKGATHFTHWFQPMTGITAEKHDSFIAPDGHGKIIMEFSGKELLKGESDASSFPNGGLRATFEARGYTVWDTTSFAFIKDGTLCIPTAFCSYGGHCLDKKTPLLRSMNALDKQAIRILRLFGNDTAQNLITTVGAEQEYFLIDKDVYLKRQDLLFTGRTLFGARPSKGQELDDHYFGTIKQRVSDYMKDLDNELWKLGIMSKTKHNEVAPAQHELAPIFTTTNIATDHNQLTMELMKSIANKHNLACLLHEKPFAGVNGSGKHNNWSISTDTGINLLAPGKTPSENAQFVLFLVAIVKAVDEYQDLLRVSVASGGNDHRLGANEAPPAILSVFLGDELTAILEAIETKTEYTDIQKEVMKLGTTFLPQFRKDTTDRNRTSPFAFTGNKFEFRMVGSSASIAGVNFVLNTIVAESLKQFADELEGKEDFNSALNNLIRETIKKHKRIIFNGNNYSDEWVVEAEKRGLSNLKTTVDALPAFIHNENVAVFEEHKVLSKEELFSRYDILLESYSKLIRIEALTMADMVKKYVLPASVSFQNEMSDLVLKKKTIGMETAYESDILTKVSNLTNSVYNKLNSLENATIETKNIEDALELAKFYRNEVFRNMSELRVVVDELETLISKKHWELPTYSEILYSVL